MTDRPQAGALIARRPRLSDRETERRMLETAAAMVNRTGLTVSLEHLSFEDVIHDAHVSRSTAYRRWPYKDLFFADLLKELAAGATPAAIADEETAMPELRDVLTAHADWLDTPEQRQRLMLELMRRGASHDFELVRRSTEWRTYLALHATFIGVADETLRAELQHTLAASERDFIARIAGSWQRLAGLLGFRLRPELGLTFENFAVMASADLRGHVLLALANPDLGGATVHAQPAGAAEPADWSLPALAIMAIAAAVFEPDPDVQWDEDRISRIRHAFD